MKPIPAARPLMAAILLLLPGTVLAALDRELDGLNGLCRASIAAGDPEEALRLCRRVGFDIARLAPGSPAHIASLINVGDVKWAAGNYVDADSWYQDALGLIVRSQGADFAAALPLVERIVETRLRRGRYLEAEQTLRQALAMLPSTLPPGDLGRARLRLRHADLLSQSHQFIEAERSYQEVIAIFAAGGPATAAIHRSALRHYAESLEREQKFARAEPVYRELLARLPAEAESAAPDAAASGEPALDKPAILDRIGYLLVQQGRFNEAQACYRRELQLLRQAGRRDVEIGNLEARIATLGDRPTTPAVELLAR